MKKEFSAGMENKVCTLGYPYVEGITWTMDAFYREIPEKVPLRRAMGAICVEMECAAMQAVCNVRGVELLPC